MRARLAPSARWLAFVAVLATAVSCAPDPEPLAFCDGAVSHVEVFNVYADHQQADLQLIDDPERIDDACAYEWDREALRRRGFDEDELAERATTVLVLHHDDGTARTIWVHRLAGVGAGTAIVADDDGSFWLPNRSLPQYYGPDAEVVDRDRVPVRPADT